MSDLTDFKLQVIGDNKNGIEHKKNIQNLSGYGKDLFNEPVKWYRIEKDMVKYSKKHSGFLFKITGENDLNPHWEAYYINGDVLIKRKQNNIN